MAIISLQSTVVASRRSELSRNQPFIVARLRLISNKDGWAAANISADSGGRAAVWLHDGFVSSPPPAGRVLNCVLFGPKEHAVGCYWLI